MSQGKEMREQQAAQEDKMRKETNQELLIKEKKNGGKDTGTTFEET